MLGMNARAAISQNSIFYVSGPFYSPHEIGESIYVISERHDVMPTGKEAGQFLYLNTFFKICVIIKYVTDQSAKFFGNKKCSEHTESGHEDDVIFGSFPCSKLKIHKRKCYKTYYNPSGADDRTVTNPRPHNNRPANRENDAIVINEG